MNTLETRLDNIFTFLGSMKVASIVIITIAIVLVMASLLPLQLSDQYVYSAIWFHLLLLCLFLITIYCQLRRWPSDISRMAVFLIHLSIPVILLGAFIGYIWGDRGYMQISENTSNNAVIRDDGTVLMLPFSVFLENFILEYYNSFETKEGLIKDYKSIIAIVDKGERQKLKTIKVNHPLEYAGYTFYQVEYDPKNTNWTGLLVKKDPGVLIVYAGYLLIIVGVFIKLIIYSIRS